MKPIARAASLVAGRSVVLGKPWDEPAEGVGTTGAGAGGFTSISPLTGTALEQPFIAASDAAIDAACKAARRAFDVMGRRPPGARAGLLERIADTLDAHTDVILAASVRETGLARGRLRMEHTRMVGTFRMFAGVIRAGGWTRPSIDHADIKSKPVKPDVRSMLRPLGPVTVFGASNFPLAYGSAGGDVASALAAGCPVVVCGHPAQPLTGELLAVLIAQAVGESDFGSGDGAGSYAFLHNGGERAGTVGQRLLSRPEVRAAGFTGSFGGGTALAKLAGERRGAHGRADPIPFFAEMGSTNPVFVLPGAMEHAAAAVAERIGDSIVERGGQQCTCPGLIFTVASSGGGSAEFTRELTRRLTSPRAITMLSAHIRERYLAALNAIARVPGVEQRVGMELVGEANAAADHAARARRGEGGAVTSQPALFRTGLDVFLKTPSLQDEVFGPAAVIVSCPDDTGLLDAAAAMPGSLGASIFAGAGDAGLAARLASMLEHRVGRLVFNGVTTGVRVCPSMSHGGPFPATNHPETTAVGPRAIERWCRPVCWQNAPADLLPPELRDDNPLKVRRMVDGQWK